MNETSPYMLLKTRRLLHGLLLLCLLFGLCLPAPSWAQKGGLKKGLESDKKQPVEITADRMRSENGGKKIIFSGQVVGLWGDLKITSDVLEIYNSEKESNETEEIIAIGNVVITRANKRATGDKAIYLDKQQKVILTGAPNATAWEDQNVVHGREMIFLLDKDRFLVNDRVRMKLYPENKEPQKARQPTKGRTDKKKIWVDAKK